MVPGCSEPVPSFSKRVSGCDAGRKRGGRSFDFAAREDTSRGIGRSQLLLGTQRYELFTSDGFITFGEVALGFTESFAAAPNRYYRPMQLETFPSARGDGRLAGHRRCRLRPKHVASYFGLAPHRRTLRVIVSPRQLVLDAGSNYVLVRNEPELGEGALHRYTLP